MSMFLGIATVEIFIPHSNSLKAKRSVMNGLKDRLKKLNASVAEVDGHDLWQRSTLGVAMVANEPGFLEESVMKIRDVLDREYRAQVVGFDWDVSPVQGQ